MPRFAQGVIVLAVVILAAMAGLLLLAVYEAIVNQQPLFSGFWAIYPVIIAQLMGILYLWLRNALGLGKSADKKMVYNTQAEINTYMKDLLKRGTTVDIVSRNLSWVQGDQSVEDAIVERSKHATLRIFVPAENAIVRRLVERGANVRVTPSLGDGQRARFTLLNRNTPGSAILAVGSGNTPSFTILEFYEAGHPKIVALARDYVNSLSAPT